jgi:hypothetical protein
MDHFGDHDGKSKTSSAVDEEHYPSGEPEENFDGAKSPTESEIAVLAYAIWEERGRLDDGHEQDWEEAERRLRGKNDVPQDYGILKEQQGSVQR